MLYLSTEEAMLQGSIALGVAIDLYLGLLQARAAIPEVVLGVSVLVLAWQGKRIVRL